MRKAVNIISLSIIILLGLLNFLSYYNSPKHVVDKVKDENEIKIIFNDGENLSLKDSIISEVSKYSFKYPKYILAQIYIETGNLSSKLFFRNNNLFGMTKAASRLTVNSHFKESEVYASYEHWKYSIIDRALFEAHYLHGKKTEEEYFKCLTNGYAEDSEYGTKIAAIANDIDKYFSLSTIK